MYLPATFIYHDLKKVDFLPDITRKYSPDPYQNQVYLDSASGNRVMKYPVGLAVQSLPFFAAGHVAAKTFGYPADGFSAPYQLSLQIGAELVAILGFVLVWWTLRRRFSEEATALTLVVLALGSNYLNYAAINSAMSHNWLFTLYAALIVLTQAFYRQPTLGRALAIGALCGLMALTRPTEILASLIPILWGLRPDRQVLAARLAFWRRHLPHLLLAAVAGAAIGSIQLLYWHYVTGHWLVYSYGDQSFSWLRPHLYDGIFSFRSGWLTYSPLMAAALLGHADLHGAVYLRHVCLGHLVVRRLVGAAGHGAELPGAGLAAGCRHELAAVAAGARGGLCRGAATGYLLQPLDHAPGPRRFRPAGSRRHDPAVFMAGGGPQCRAGLHVLAARQPRPAGE
jgi:hypothetical protein